MTMMTSHALHAAFIVSTEPSLRGDDDEEDKSLVYAYPDASAGGAAASTNAFKSLGLAVRGVLDSICGEKVGPFSAVLTKLVSLEQGGERLLLAFGHLEACMLVLALRSFVQPSAATSLAIQTAETLVLLLGPFSEWAADTGTAARGITLRPEAQAILDRVFDATLRQIDSHAWAMRLAPWQSFEGASLYLSLPAKLQQKLDNVISEHAALTVKSPFSFFRKHSCLMYRGLLLASDLLPQHTKQLWQLCWCLGVFQHTSGLPCQVLTRIVHLAQPMATRPAPNNALLADSSTTVSEQTGRSLLVLAAACNLSLAVVLTAYDEEIEEELAGRLEGHAAAELLQKIHSGLGTELDRVIDASGVYSVAAHGVDGTAQAAARAVPNMPAAKGDAGSLFMKLMLRKRPSARNAAAAAAAAAANDISARGVPPSPAAAAALASPLNRAQTSPLNSPATKGPLPVPFGPLAADRSLRGGGGPQPGLPSPGMQPVAAPEGSILVIAHEPLQGVVRILGDMPGASSAALPSVWRTVQLCRTKFSASTIAVAAPPKHSRLTMTLDQIEQLSAVRSQREGGQRLGTADSSPWQYHPEVAALAAVQQMTVKLPAVQPQAATPGSGGGGITAASMAAAASSMLQASSSKRGGMGASADLYLTACLFSDMREVFVVHTAAADEGRILEGLCEGPAAALLWKRESASGGALR